MRDDNTVYVVACQPPDRPGILIAGNPGPYVLSDAIQAARLADQLERAGAVAFAVVPRSRAQVAEWLGEILPEGGDG